MNGKQRPLVNQVVVGSNTEVFIQVNHKGMGKTLYTFRFRLLFDFPLQTLT